MKMRIYILSAIMVLGLIIVPSHAGTSGDEDLTKQLSAVLRDIYKIKPGMTRAELDKMFGEERGGLVWPSSQPFPFRQHETFDYSRCGLVHIDVDFRASDSKDERPTDIIDKISTPYLAGRLIY